MPASPNVLNYFIGKGLLFWTPQGGIERALGNAPQFQVTPNVTKLDHFSSQSGIATKDRSATQKKEATVTIQLDEITPENLALALFGTPETNSDGDREFSIMGAPEQVGRLRLQGNNEIGSRYNVVVDRVSLTPSEAVDFIGEEFGIITISGDCEEVVTGAGFGLVTEILDAPTT